MAASDHQDTYGHPGPHFAEPGEVFKGFASSLERATEVEGTEAAKVVSESVQEFLLCADAMLDDLGGDAAKGTAARSSVYLEDIIRKQPRLAVGIAAAAGLLFASLRRR